VGIDLIALLIALRLGGSSFARLIQRLLLLEVLAGLGVARRSHHKTTELPPPKQLSKTPDKFLAPSTVNLEQQQEQQ
jgi:hypothetical protein